MGKNRDRAERVIADASRRGAVDESVVLSMVDAGMKISAAMYWYRTLVVDQSPSLVALRKRKAQAKKTIAEKLDSEEDAESIVSALIDLGFSRTHAIRMLRSEVKKRGIEVDFKLILRRKGQKSDAS